MEIMKQSWPWYVTGPLIGLMVPFLLIFGNKMFGISSSLRHICAACIPSKIPYFNYDWKKEMWNVVFALGIVAGAFVAAQYMSYLPMAAEADAYTITQPQKHNFSKEGHDMGSFHPYMWRDDMVYPAISENARVMFMSMGLNSTYYHPAPVEIFSWEKVFTPPGLFFMLLGGFLVGFGTRYANGCTSGHSIMGLSQFSPASLVATIGFFAGGIICSWFIVPYLLKAFL